VGNKAKSSGHCVLFSLTLIGRAIGGVGRKAGAGRLTGTAAFFLTGAWFTIGSSTTVDLGGSGLTSRPPTGGAGVMGWRSPLLGLGKEMVDGKIWRCGVRAVAQPGPDRQGNRAIGQTGSATWQVGD
jgi:hypothetical protein